MNIKTCLWSLEAFFLFSRTFWCSSTGSLEPKHVCVSVVVVPYVRSVLTIKKKTLLGCEGEKKDWVCVFFASPSLPVIGSSV